MNTPVSLTNPDARRGRNGFTLVELLALLLVLALLASLVAPALAKTKPGTRNLVCLNNTRQLLIAWQMYHEENNGRLVMNFHGGGLLGGSIANTPGNAPWACGWLDWTTSSDNTNVQLIASEKYSRLAKYHNRSASVFKCPADVFLSSAQKARGWFQRARSYSANIGIGDGNAEEGPWDASMYKHIKKVSDFQYPSPAETYVLMEEHPDSMNDAGVFNPRPTQWVDIPATYHDGACRFGFADGHSELHQWKASLTALRARQVRFTDGSDLISQVAPRLNDVDVHWISYRAGRISANSY